MISLPELLQNGVAAGWLFIPSALLLGALHGLEPGHAKTMMAAFIVAIRGTVKQAVMLGLAATVSHTLVVWLVALAGLRLSRSFDAATSEPYFQLAASAVMLCVGLWMLAQRRSVHREHHHKNHGTPAFASVSGFFKRLFSKKHRHARAGGHPISYIHDEHGASGLTIGADGWQDAHERKHALDIQRRFTGGAASNGQIILFGLTGGLIPCPAAITVLLICLQLKQTGLAIGLVLCFSIGLAATMTAAGVIAALSLRHIRRHWPGLSLVASAAPYLSGIVIVVIGLVTGAAALRASGVAPDTLRHLIVNTLRQGESQGLF